MTGPTHKQYAISFACISVMILYKLGITSIAYYLAIPIVLMTSKVGAKFPDVDHSWDNVSDKTVVNKIINVLIHLTGGKHRSWQTHSIDICTYFTIFAFNIPNMLFNMGILSSVNKEVLSILLLGFASGWVSHLFSDMLTYAGVRLVCFIDFKVRLVPKKIGKIKFNTANEWEKFNYKIIRIINILLGIICLLYPFIVSGYIKINF